MIQNINEIKSNIDIVEIIQSYIPLKKSGANYITKCPFHNENTASMSVSKTKNIFHCFGCGEGGNGIDFIMKYERLDFTNAIKKAGEICGIQVEETQSKDYAKSLATQEKLEKFYYKCYKALLENEKLVEYLAKRGFKKDVLEEYGFGYCLEIDEIKAILGTQLAFSLGFLTEKGHNFFKDRILLCIRDEKNKIVGFSGRVHDFANFYKAGKYINSKESFLYKKNSILYNYTNAYEILKKHKHKRLYIVEGYFDALTCNLLEIPAVAICSANLHVNQLRLLSRLLKDEITLCIALDSDDAGRSGSIRAYKLCFENGYIETKITRLHKDYKDLNEFYTKGDVKDLPFIEYDGLDYCLKVETGLAKSIKEKKEIIQGYEKILNNTKDIFTREYIKKYLKAYISLPTQEPREYSSQEKKEQDFILTQLARDKNKVFITQDILNANDFFNKDVFQDILESKDSPRVREYLFKEIESIDTELFYKIALRFKIHNLEKQRRDILRNTHIDINYIMGLNDKISELKELLEIPF